MNTVQSSGGHQGDLRKEHQLEELVPVGDVERNWRGVLIALLVIVIVLGLILASTLALSPPDKGPRATAPKISLQHVISGEFDWSNNASWISEYEISYRDSLGGISIFNVENGTSIEFLNNATFRQLNAVDYRISADKHFIVFLSEVKKVFTNTREAYYHMFDKESLSRHSLGPKDTNLDDKLYKLQRFQFSPTDNAFAFVYNNDLYYSNTSKIRTPVRLTRTGSSKVWNGFPDWLYQEEIFKDDCGFWFSPNSRYLAFAVFNDTNVGEVSFPVYNTKSQYDQLVTISYPKPGTPIPEISLFLVHLASDYFNITKLQSPKTFEISRGYLLKVQWTSEIQLDVVWMNRGQNLSYYMTCPAPDFNCTKTYVERGGGEDGLVPLHADPIQWRWSITALHVHGIFDSYVYFEASPEEKSTERHLYRIPENKLSEECLTCPGNKTENNTTQWPIKTEYCLYTKSKFSPSGKYYMLECLGPEVPTVHIIETASNLKLHTFENNTDLKNKYHGLSVPQIKLFQVETDTGGRSQVRLQMPAGLREYEDMTFPLVLRLSYKPGEKSITQKWSLDFSSYLVSQRNFLIVDIEPSSRKYDVVEHVAVIRYLKDLRFVDKSKMSLFGSGYGGYLAPLILAEDSLQKKKDQLFPSAVVVSGIFNWANYNALWSERFAMDDGAGRVASRLDGKKLLFIHATLDLVAHYSQLMSFSADLVQAGVIYCHLAYPDEDNEYSSMRLHMYETIVDFMDRALSPIDYTEWETGTTYFSFRP